MASGLPFSAPQQGGPEQTGQDVTAQFAPSPPAMTVTQLVASVKEALQIAFPARLAVVGEISNFKKHGSGHLYFCLKDSAACIDAVMFRPDVQLLRFAPADGLEVVAEGRVDVYDRSGRLQFYVSRLSPRGAGALELAFRQLKERLAQEGLFEPAHKLPLARFPRGIGLITSRTGAAVRDIVRTLQRRWPAAGVYLLPVQVQGEGAAEQIAEAIGQMDASARRLQIDTIILARGGGSLEDLWAFNEEAVARAIYACNTPIVCGVGHETDFTIADFVADVRAATPTAAAELATPDRAELVRTMAALSSRLHRRLGEVLRAAQAALSSVRRSVVFRDPRAALRSQHQRLDELATRFRHRLGNRCRQGEQRLHAAERSLAARQPMRLLETARAKLAALRRDLAWALGHRAKRAGDGLAHLAGQLLAAHPGNRLLRADEQVKALARQLEAMSHRAVLKRGFSITRLADGSIVRAAGQAKSGDWLNTELAEGKLDSQVGGLAQPPAATGERVIQTHPAVRRKHKSDIDAPGLFDEA